MGKGDGAADGARDALEGDGELGRYGGGCGGSWGGLAVDGAGEAGADLDQLVEDASVILHVLAALAGAVCRLGRGGRDWRTSGRISWFLARGVKH